MILNRCWMWPWTLAVLVLSSSVATASPYKCVDATGRVSFQQLPCAGKPLEANQVKVMRGPTLTPEEEFRGAAYRAGMTPEEAIEHLRGQPRQGPPDQLVQLPQRIPEPGKEVASSGETALECHKPNGKVYYRSREEGCGTSTVAGEPQQRNWQNDRVVGAPGAVMTSPNTAVHNGQTIHLQHTSTTVIPRYRVDDQAKVVDRQSACIRAREDAKRQRDANMHLTYDQRQKIDDKVREICKGVDGL